MKKITFLSLLTILSFSAQSMPTVGFGLKSWEIEELNEQIETTKNALIKGKTLLKNARQKALNSYHERQDIHADLQAVGQEYSQAKAKYTVSQSLILADRLNQLAKEKSRALREMSVKQENKLQQQKENLPSKVYNIENEEIQARKALLQDAAKSAKQIAIYSPEELENSSSLLHAIKSESDSRNMDISNKWNEVEDLKQELRENLQESAKNKRFISKGIQTTNAMAEELSKLERTKKYSYLVHSPAITVRYEDIIRNQMHRL